MKNKILLITIFVIVLFIFFLNISTKNKTNKNNISSESTNKLTEIDIESIPEFITGATEEERIKKYKDYLIDKDSIISPPGSPNASKNYNYIE